MEEREGREGEEGVEGHREGVQRVERIQETRERREERGRWRDEKSEHRRRSCLEVRDDVGVLPVIVAQPEQVVIQRHGRVHGCGPAVLAIHQGLTLVHFSAQPELFLTQKHTRRTHSQSLTPDKHPLNNPEMHPLSQSKRLR